MCMTYLNDASITFIYLTSCSIAQHGKYTNTPSGSQVLWHKSFSYDGEQLLAVSSTYTTNKSVT